MKLGRVLLLVSITMLIAAAAAPAASGKSTGACPRGTSAKWVLATVDGLGVSPEVASGIASLDDNGDGLTCIRQLFAGTPECDMDFPIIFRDNTVPGPQGEPLDCGFGPG